VKLVIMPGWPSPWPLPWRGSGFQEAEKGRSGNTMLKEIKIANINVGSRHRKEMGDLTSLAESIRQEGMLA
jgi:hypothetical protein